MEGREVKGTGEGRGGMELRLGIVRIGSNEVVWTGRGWSWAFGLGKEWWKNSTVGFVKGGIVAFLKFVEFVLALVLGRCY